MSFGDSDFLKNTFSNVVEDLSMPDRSIRQRGRTAAAGDSLSGQEIRETKCV